MPLPEARPSAKIAKLFPPTNQKPADRKAARNRLRHSTVTPAGEPARAAPTPAAKAASSKPLRCPRRGLRSGPCHHAGVIAPITAVAGIARRDETPLPPERIRVAAPPARTDGRGARVCGKALRGKPSRCETTSAGVHCNARLEVNPPGSAKPATWSEIRRQSQPENRLKLNSPPPAPLTRRERSQLSRGRKDIDARIDLHGMTQTRAHRALLQFLQNASGDGLASCLSLPARAARRGWTPSGVYYAGRSRNGSALPEFRSLVVGFDEAHIRPWRRGRALRAVATPSQSIIPKTNRFSGLDHPRSRRDQKPALESDVGNQSP